MTITVADEQGLTTGRHFVDDPLAYQAAPGDLEVQVPAAFRRPVHAVLAEQTDIEGVGRVVGEGRTVHLGRNGLPLQVGPRQGWRAGDRFALGLLVPDAVERLQL